MQELVTIPNIALPFEIPAMIHPLFAHFAIALPVVIFLLEIINLVIKRRSISFISLFFMLILTLIYFGAYLTGSTDAKLTNNLSADTLELLNSHKQFGIYLFYGSILVILLKLLSFIDKAVIKFFFFLALIGLGALSFSTGKKGGALVYAHGLNVKCDVQKPKAKEQKEATEPTAKQPAKEEPKEQKAEEKVEQNNTKVEHKGAVVTKEENKTKEDTVLKDSASNQEENKTNKIEQNSSSVEQNTTKTKEVNKSIEGNSTIKQENNSSLDINSNISSLNH